MLDIKFIREKLTQVKAGIAAKQVKVDLKKLLKLDEQRRQLLTQVENLKAQKNQASKEIPKLSKKDKAIKIKELKDLDNQTDKLQNQLKPIENEFNQLMLMIPNLPATDVKFGRGEKENEIIKKVGKPTKFDFEFKDYLTLGQELDLIDIKRAAKVSGTRFGYLKNQAVLLQFALINYAFETLTVQGFIPLIPPIMIKESAMRGMGYLERGEDDVFKTTKNDFYLIGTAEQSGIPLHMNEVLQEKELPKRYVAYSTCLRSEAGSYGKDTKGILRVHQFDKVEMISFTKPENSDKEHEYLLSLEKKLMQGLKLPYQVTKMCSGDLGDPAARKYDIETWIPSEGKYRETHSTSNCTSFQARRLRIRYRQTKNQRTRFVHTLNGTAFALGRTLIAIIENYQTANGEVKIPEVLQKYLSFKIIKKDNY